MTAQSSVLAIVFALGFAAQVGAATVDVDSVSELVAAINTGANGDTIRIAAGTYQIPASLSPKPGMTVTGAGIGKTILKPAAGWNPYKTGLPYDFAAWQSANGKAHLFNLGGRSEDSAYVPWGNDNITISHLTIDGMKQLHGALFGWDCSQLVLSHLLVTNFTWCGVRLFASNQVTISDSEFINVTAAGLEGGGIYATWLEDSRITNNQFYHIRHGQWYGAGGVDAGGFFGIKGHQFRRCRIDHNTIMVNFSVELAFGQDRDVEIDHNVMWGWISIPRWADPLPAGQSTFHIHHNYFTEDFQIELPRDGVLVEKNLFDFKRERDGGSLFVGWLDQRMVGPVVLRDNLIKDPGRHLLVFYGFPVDNLQIINNHVIAHPTVTPRTGALLELDGRTTWATLQVKNNIFDCTTLPRPLFNTSAAYAGQIENNTFTNVTTSSSMVNPDTGAKRGPREILDFICGAPGNQYRVQQWMVTPFGATQRRTTMTLLPGHVWGALTPPTIVVQPPSGGMQAFEYLPSDTLLLAPVPSSAN